MITYYAVGSHGKQQHVIKHKLTEYEYPIIGGQKPPICINICYSLCNIKLINPMLAKFFITGTYLCDNCIKLILNGVKNEEEWAKKIKCSLDRRYGLEYRWTAGQKWELRDLSDKEVYL